MTSHHNRAKSAPGLAHPLEVWHEHAPGCTIDRRPAICQMLWRLMVESKAAEKPTHIAVIFDKGRTTLPQLVRQENLHSGRQRVIFREFLGDLRHV